ncbi:MAG: hypothetical protein JW986_10540 [Methanotrichaceae archaeon]|nr:hypothetical protein [Methanotrichaceae archaeon]
MRGPPLATDESFEAPDLDHNEKGKIIPVIYQPAVDALYNFLREGHSAPSTGGGIEVILIFNNEDLRRHSMGSVLNPIYEAFRWLRYGRVLDVETFRIYIDRGGEFIFEEICSNGHGLYEDDIHGDPPIAPRRVIKHFFANAMHPVVFVNTSNHAMAEYDSNHCLWKWEYIPGTMGCPVKLGQKSREEIERSFRPLFRFW